MAIYKLNIDEFDEIDYQLIAIHTSLEDYRLAFFINQTFPVLLSKNPEDIHITAKSGSTTLSRYSYESPSDCAGWDLLQNRNEVYTQDSSARSDLFAGSGVRVATKAYLLPEFKKVDYLLRLENLDKDADTISEGLQTIQQVTMSYVLDTSRIKSINNLIF